MLLLNLVMASITPIPILNYIKFPISIMIVEV